MPVDPPDASRLAEQMVPDPDFDGVLSSVADIIEAARQLGKAAEHGDTMATKQSYLALVKHVGLVSGRFAGSRFHRLGQSLAQAGEAMREEVVPQWRRK